MWRDKLALWHGLSSCCAGQRHYAAARQRVPLPRTAASSLISKHSAAYEAEAVDEIVKILSETRFKARAACHTPQCPEQAAERAARGTLLP